MKLPHTERLALTRRVSGVRLSCAPSIYFAYGINIHFKNTMTNRKNQESKEGTKLVKLRIKELRQKKGMSQTDLAKAMNISPVAVSRWELGFTLPTTDKLPQLAMLLGVDVSALFAVETPSRLPETLS